MPIELTATDARRSLNRFDPHGIRAFLEIVDNRFKIRIDDLHSWEWLELEGDLVALCHEIQRARDRCEKQ